MRFFALCALLPVLSAAEPWDRVTAIAPRTSVRVYTFSGDTHKGTLSAASPEEIRVSAQGQEVNVPRANVKRVQVYSAARRWRRVLIFGAIGAGLGIAAGIGACPSCIGESSGYPERAAALGAAGGGAIGAGLGALSAPYKTVYKGKR